MPLESQSGCVVQGALILTQIQDLPGICSHGWLIQNLINDFLGLTNKPAPESPSNMHPRSSKQLLTARVAASSPHMAGPHGRIAIYKPSRGRLKVTETCTILHWATAVIWGWPCWPMSKICGTPSVNHAFYVDGNSTHKFTTGWYEHPPVISWFLTIYICVCIYVHPIPQKNRPVLIF